MDFKNMDVSTIATGVSGSGVRYLETFLQEYTALTGETVNPGCNKCLTSYLTKYKKLMATENKSGYRLHAKWENIPLEFGSPILVNNDNITKEYAQQLLDQPDGQRYFAEMPAKKAEGTSVKVAEKTPKKVKANATAPKKKAVTKAEAPVVEDEQIEVILTDDHLNGNQELKETYKAGDIVLVNKTEYEKDGTISIVDKE